MKKPTTPGSKTERRMRIKDENVFYGISQKEKRMLSQLLGAALIAQSSSAKRKSKNGVSKRTGTPSTAGVRRS